MKKKLIFVIFFVYQINVAQNNLSPTENVGIGTTTPVSKLSIVGSVTINGGLNNTLARPVLSAETSEYGEIRGYSMHGNLKDDGFLRLSAGGGTTPWAKTYIDISGYSTVPDMDRNIVFGTSNVERMRINQAGNLGIGTNTPFSKLSISGSITINSGLNNNLPRPALTAGTSEYGEVRGFSMHGNALDDGFLRLSAGGGSTPWAKTYIDISGYSNVPDMDRNIVFGTSNVERMRINQAGNIGIGTKNPDSKLTVAGNVHAQEVKVTVKAGEVPDYVFAKDYKLKSLQEVENYIKENSHLPEIPSAQEIEKNGLMLANMNLSLLKKIEELTLHAIEQQKNVDQLIKKVEEQNTRINSLENK